MKKSIVGIGAIAVGSALVYWNYKKYYKKYNILPEYRSIFRFTFKKHMIDKNAISLMKKDVVVLNFARDVLVNEEHMVDALLSGTVKKYVTDFPNPIIPLHTYCYRVYFLLYP